MGLISQGGVEVCLRLRLGHDVCTVRRKALHSGTAQLVPPGTECCAATRGGESPTFEVACLSSVAVPKVREQTAVAVEMPFPVPAKRTHTPGRESRKVGVEANERRTIVTI